MRIVYLCWKYKIGMSDKTLNIKGTLMSLSTPVVMGILNVTPDSFYAGSRKQTEADIEERIQAILSEGGQIIDVGGYSSRPDAEEVSPEEEMERLDGQIEAAARDFVKLRELMEEKDEKEKLLEEKMERWMYLNELADRIAADR